jgi:Peptidase_C39 like family
MRAVLTFRILLVFVSAVALAQPFDPPPNRPTQSAWIPLNHQLQERNLCVPTSASIILDYFGDSISPRKIKALSLHKQYTPGDRFTDFSITFFRDLIVGLAGVGYDWNEKSYPNNHEGFERGLGEIERSLDAAVPVMIDTSHYGGHTFVVAGYSVPDRKLFIVDPGAPPPGMRAAAFKDIEHIWNSRAVGANLRGAVFPRRRPEANR